MPDRDDAPLKRYRAKRSADRTPEPFGGEAVPAVPGAAGPAAAGEAARASLAGAAPSWGQPRLFCVQKHAARRLHYDLRLEWGGVLRSWAVPKGPSADPGEKRLAVEVEDHPVAYADFEGVIPEGNYGAGEAIVWDRGVWVPLEDPDETLPRGKLTFELRGYKLRGAWHLFRTKGKGKTASKDWMLVKRADGWASPTSSYPEQSVDSGLTVEELRAGSMRAAELGAELARLAAPRRELRAEGVKLMLAEVAERPFSDPAWVFELKYDGFRVLGSREAGEPHLRYRRGEEATAVYPEIARALRLLPFGDLVLDGEIVVLDQQGRPSFQQLQQRAQQRRKPDIERGALEQPATFCVFDLLGFEGYDLRPLPLVERKRLLQLLLPRAGPLRFVEHIATEGEAFYEEVVRLGLEGVMGKRAASPYVSGRSSEWRKLRRLHVDDFVVVGWSDPRGGRTGFGALQLAACEGDALVYCGRVGSGFDEKLLRDLALRLEPDRRDSPPCAGPVPSGRDQAWVEPRLVVEVRYHSWTAEGLLRQPVFLRLREDKLPTECPMPARQVPPPDRDEEPGAAASRADAATARPNAATTPAPQPPVEKSPSEGPDRLPGDKKVPFSNLGKLFWPDEGYTKGDLIEYYRQISPWLLPYLRDRLLVLTRYPDGIKGKSFFQKDAPGFAPGWVRLERVWSEEGGREIDYFVADDLETLLYVINLGTIPLHVWGSRSSDLAHPDWCILDLDPKGAPFAHVVEIAQAIHALAQEIVLPTYIKTSGSSGLHVLVPLGRLLTFQQCRQLGELLARVVSSRLKEIATIARAPRDRGGRVYIDYLQNGHGKLLAAPFSARPVPGALASAPLLWDEVDESLDPRAFTIKTLPERMSAFGRDPLAPVLSESVDLQKALERLAARLP
jgi:bifunctional non-homologous end joining protein LigD